MTDSGTGYQASLRTVLREWGRIGVTGFGGPPAHIALLRKPCVQREGWLDAFSAQPGQPVSMPTARRRQEFCSSAEA